MTASQRADLERQLNDAREDLAALKPGNPVAFAASPETSLNCAGRREAVRGVKAVRSLNAQEGSNGGGVARPRLELE